MMIFKKRNFWGWSMYNAIKENKTNERFGGG